MNLKNRIFLAIDVLKASFISLVPFYILYSLILLAVELVIQFSINVPIEKENLYDLVKLLNSLLPLLINVSISYHLASLYYITINRLLTIILSLIVYLSVDILNDTIHMSSYYFPESMIMAVLIPILISFILLRLIILESRYNQNIKKSLSRNVAASVIYIIPFIIVYFVVTLFFFSLNSLFEIENNFSFFSEGYEVLLVYIRTLVSSILWFFGIHGLNFFDAFINVKLLDNIFLDNLTYERFYNLFIVIGGSGVGLSLVLAIFIASKDKHTTFVGKVSLPFVFFNINEILIFGIPIFMNFSLIVPFVLVPIVNLSLAYLFFSNTEIILFHDVYISWTTPPLINIYMASGGNIIAVLFQFFLIIIGTLIYIPFIKKYSQSQSSTVALERISNKLDIAIDIDSKADIKFQEAQSNILKSHFKVNKVIDVINANNLLLHYQPKIDIKNQVCNDFEALLRIKDEKGKISGPDFIIDIENSGFASIVDIWVCKEVKKDLDTYKDKSFSPEISINIFPDTLENIKNVYEIIDILKGYNISFEILERRSALNIKVLQNIKILKENGFKISLDDVGIGFTNFSMLYEFPLDTVKIDRKILSFTNEKKGYVLYKNICKLCSDLDLKIVIEGVETKEELDKLINEDVSLVQGWYFSKAIAFENIEDYSKNFKV